MNYFVDCLTKKYACFSGRARRQEYWLFVLFNFIASTILKFIAGALISMTGLAVLAIIPLLYSLAVLIPGFAVFFRRLHDTGRPPYARYREERLVVADRVHSDYRLDRPYRLLLPRQPAWREPVRSEPQGTLT